MSEHLQVLIAILTLSGGLYECV